jgi:hypothetical protein
VLPPEQDLHDRGLLWNQMQMFWMDTDPAIFLDEIATACADSKYTIDELAAIYWNEVRPAVSFNMLMLPAPEWAGFDAAWLRDKVLETHRFGRRLPLAWFDTYGRGWWRRLAEAIASRRGAEGIEGR